MSKFTVAILFALLGLLLAAHSAEGQEPLARAKDFSAVKVTEYKPILSLKTNMLYNMALTPNAAAEAPIGKNWSLSAGFMRGWWLERGWSFCWQVEAAELEARYWFRRNEKQPTLSGWFVGAFGAIGRYDFQLERDRGVQGELTGMGGIAGGYVFPLGQRWRVELTAGAGYLLSDYRRYAVEYSEGSHVLVRSGPDKRLKALYPLKAGLVLVWVFNKKREWLVDKETIMDEKPVEEAATTAPEPAATPTANEAP
jgi:hypothetical protein